jgi:hypothetical protein
MACQMIDNLYAEAFGENPTTGERRLSLVGFYAGSTLGNTAVAPREGAMDRVRRRLTSLQCRIIVCRVPEGARSLQQTSQ